MKKLTLFFVTLSYLFAVSPSLLGGTGQAPRGIDYGPGRQIAVLANKAINESSGLAASRATPGVLWTHNDSGDRPRIFALNTKGESLATVGIKGASARDWEDIASFTLNNKHYLLLADVGDNPNKRKSSTLYIIHEPKIDPQKRDVLLTASVLQEINFTYKDGPHNCESVAVDPTNNLILLVSKDPKRTVYTLPLPNVVANTATTAPAATTALDQDGTKGKKLIAKPIANLPIFWTTGMDISPDSLRAIVLTYGCAYEYVRKPGETWSKAFHRKGRIVNVPARRQGESICYGLDGETLYLTSEKLPTPLFEVPAKKTE